MRKALLTLSLAAVSIIGFGQARLGFSKQEIRTEFIAPRYNLQSGYTDDGTYFISIEVERASVIYLFNSEGYCTATGIIPDNQGALNFFVEMYNDRYVIISPTEWKMYSEDGILSIKLIYPENGGYYFVWTQD